MRNWKPGAFRLALLTAAAVLAIAPAAAQARSVDAYRGLGSWVDLYDGRAMENAETTLNAMASHGVRTLYVETANFQTSVDIVRPLSQGALLDGAHARGIKVVAWYLPSFKNVARDLRRSRAAIRFRSGTGQTFDSFALDIESSAVRRPSLRTARLLRLSAQIRRSVGAGYPLGAITPAPRGMQLSPRYWPAFPFQGLAGYYDVFLPMGYFTYRGRLSPAAVYDYTAQNVDLIRAGTLNPQTPVHPIGGIANRASGPQVAAFARAAQDHGSIGASLYDFGTSGPEDWRAMAGVFGAPAP